MTNETSGASPSGGALSSLLDRVLSSLNALGSLWIFFLMVMVNADVIGRTFFLAPIDGVNEMIELSLVGIVFLQMGDATRHGRLTRSDGFFNFMLRRKPKIGRMMGATFDLLGAFFIGLILWGSTPLLFEAWEGDFYVGQEGVFTAPVWPVKLVIVIGCLVTILLFLRFAWRYLRPADSEPSETPDSVN
jgi:TRAP-type C4-dicarboxylate transport system permease small subunit